MRINLAAKAFEVNTLRWPTAPRPSEWWRGRPIPSAARGQNSHLCSGCEVRQRPWEQFTNYPYAFHILTRGLGRASDRGAEA